MSWVVRLQNSAVISLAIPEKCNMYMIELYVI